MRYARVMKGYSCSSCGRHEDGLPSYRRPGYFETLLGVECRCGGEFEHSLECPDCGELFAESLAVEDGGELYCPECRAECCVCGGIFLTEDTVEDREWGRLGRKLRICKSCHAEEVAS